MKQWLWSNAGLSLGVTEMCLNWPVWSHLACLLEHTAEGSSSEDNLTGALILFILSRLVHVTGLLSSLGVRGSCWLVSIVSESCSDTAQKSKRKKKKRKLSPNNISSLAFWKSTTCTLTCFARLSGESCRQLTLYLLEQIIQWSNFQYMLFSNNWWTKKHCSTDRRSEPLQSFHLEHLAADVSVALRVFFWPTIPENRC